jgi:hypothetical protein
MSAGTLEREMKNAWLDFTSLNAIAKRLGFRWKGFHPFIWVINLALFSDTRKRIHQSKLPPKPHNRR